MKNVTRKFIAWLMAFMMLFGILPTNALAEVFSMDGSIVVDTSSGTQIPGYESLLVPEIVTANVTVSSVGAERILPGDAEVGFQTVSPESISSQVQNYYNPPRRGAKAVVPTDGKVYTVLGAYDINISVDDKDWQPADGESVNVRVDLKQQPLTKSENGSLSLLHFGEDGSISPVNATFYSEGGNQITGFSFSATGFSVYAVIESVTPRLTLTFKERGGADAVMIIKAADTEAEVAQIIYDPGVEGLANNEVFKGWVEDQEFTAETPLLTIDDIRTAARTTVAGLTADSSEDYYPAIYKQYTIEYISGGENSITQGKELAETPKHATQIPYTVNQGYTVDDNHNFEGWLVSDGRDNIVSATYNGTALDISDPDTIYPNGTQMVLTGSVQFAASAPEGHWLVFDENGKGGKYNAPQFVLTGSTTSQPVPNSEMTRYGYSFGGWYYFPEGATIPAADAHGSRDLTNALPYTFGRTIDETTTIYAKWNPNTNASYTVIFWTQNLDRTGYEVADSYAGQNGTVGQEITYTVVDNGDEDYVTGIGNYGHYTGFNLVDADKNQHVEITPEGDAVLNLHYDRIEYNFKFYLYRDGTQNNRWDYANNSGTGRELNDLVTWHTNQTEHPSVSGYTIQSENVGGRTYHYFSITAYYGQDISGEGMWPRYSNFIGANGRDAVSFVMMVGTALKPNPTSTGTGTVKGVISVMNENILGATNSASGNYVVVRFPGNANNWRYHIWFETVEGEDYSNKTTHVYNEKTYYEDNVMEVRSSNLDVDAQNEPKYTGFDFDTKLGNNWNPNDISYWTSGNNPTLYHLNYIYNRQQYKISYFDGNYVDGNGNQIQNRASQLLHESSAIGQGATIADEYINYVPNLPNGEAGYVFEGWYLDEGCTTKYTWTKMPVGGIQVYAKWRQIQYRVFLHPMADISEDPLVVDTTLDWGSASQQMNFRGTYGKKISVPTGKRHGYEFFGWYTDPNYSHVFNANTVLNDSTVTAAYDKTVDMTDTMDIWGHGATTNSDITGNNGTDRFWITRKLDLYAKWSAIVIGADGIGIVYDANGGTNAPTDHALYVDNASVIAGSASTPPQVAEGETPLRFKHWVLQTWNGTAYVDTNTVLLPGESFHALTTDAKITDNNNGGAVIAIDDLQDDGRYTYTVQLRAEYEEVEEPTPTHIDWYRNDGSAAFHSDTTGEYGALLINEAVAIQGAQTRTGYKFLGWARVEEPATGSVATTQSLTASDLYLFYSTDGSFHVNSETGTTVTKVAADEKQPYHAMFAVWQAELAIRITGNNATKAYNGSEQSVTGFTVEYKVANDDWTSTAPSGVTVALKQGKTAEAKGTNVDGGSNTDGTYPMGLSIDDFDVTYPDTYYYNAAGSSIAADGWLKITPIALTITAGSDSKVYDGTALTKDSYTSSGLASGDSIDSVTVTGSQTVVGSSANVPSDAVIKNAAGTVVTGNYTISYANGTLEVTKRKVTLTSATDSKVYDGQPLTNDTGTVARGGVAEGEAAR